MTSPPPDFRIGHLILEPHWQGLLTEIEAIFFSASNTQSFADPEEKAAFAERWLGRYLARYPEHFFVARGEAGPVVGYLAGCLESPASSGRFADITYYSEFAALCAAYPAHLHINVDAQWRRQGVGAALIEAFARHAAAAGAPGLHIVTGKAARNVAFYERNGFAVLGEAIGGSGPIVFMGRRLEPRQPR
jgi:GNAT superfamily N-acetyltransferase